MNLREYIENLNNLAKGNPEALDYEVISSKDDEGNGFNVVHYEPSIGGFNDGEFYPKDFITEEDMDIELNAVCVN